MPTDIYIGDIPIEEAYLGDDPIEIDDNNGCRPCAAYTLRRQSFPSSPATWVSASNCFNGQTYVIDINSAVTRVFFASEIIAIGPNGVFGSIGNLSDSQGGNACKQVYGKEEYLPTDSVTFNNPSLGSFNMVGWVGKYGDWEQHLISPGGSIPGACTISGSFMHVCQMTSSATPC